MSKPNELPPEVPDWLKRVEVNSRAREAFTASEAQRVSDLDRAVKELRRAN